MVTNLWDAWRVWLDGRPTADFQLFGVRVLWWARFGKIGEFVGALTVVLDIIGPTRLREWGRSLRGPRQAAAISQFKRVWARSLILPLVISAFLFGQYLRGRQAMHAPRHEKEQLFERNERARVALRKNWGVEWRYALMGTVIGLTPGVIRSGIENLRSCQRRRRVHIRRPLWLRFSRHRVP